MLRNDVYKRFFVISAIVLITSVGQTLGATYVVSPDYEDKFIQATINRAGYGDRIIVKSGLYTENLNVTKKVALIGLDTGGGKPVVNAGGWAAPLSSPPMGCCLRVLRSPIRGSCGRTPG